MMKSPYPRQFDPSTNGGASAADLSSEAEVDLREVAVVLRRRWWLIALAVVVALFAAWMVERRQPSTFTATALLQKETRGSPLAGFTTGLGGSSLSSQAIGSELEVLRSRAVLGPVVDSLGLRLRTDYGGARGDLFSAVDVAQEAPAARYMLRRLSSGSELSLSEVVSGRQITTARLGAWLEGPGIRLLLADSFPLEEPVEVAVVYGETAVERLRGRLRVNQPTGTELIRVEYTDPDPRLAAAVVATVAEVYRAHDARMAREEAHRRRIFLGEQFAVVGDSLRAAQSLQLRYQEQSGTVAPEVEGQALIVRLMEAESQLRELRYQHAILTTLTRSLTEGMGDESLRRTVALGSEVVPGASALYNRLQELQTEKSRLTLDPFTGVTRAGPGVAVLDSLIAETKTEMREMAQQALAVVDDRRQTAEQRVADLQGELRNLPGRSTGFARLKQQADAVQGTYDLLAEKYYEAQIAEAVEGGDVKIVDPPVVPVRPDPSHAGRTFMLALMIGLLVGGLGTLSLEYFDRSIRQVDEAEAQAGAPMLASIPRLRGGLSTNGRSRPYVVENDQAGAAEAFRSLATMLRFSRSERPRVIVVTSPEPAEGKSTVAANLAATLAVNGNRVVLIDADFPRSVQHDTFGLKRGPGLANLLLGEATLDEAIQRDPARRLDVITAGTTVPHASALLTGEPFRNLVQQLAREYDSVIVDTAPILVMSDATAIATISDGMLIVVRAGQTDRFALHRASDQVRLVGGDILGVVMNDVSSSFGYGRYARYEGLYSSYHEQDGGSKRSALNRLRNRLGV